jgi:hypothetical protein
VPVDMTSKKVKTSDFDKILSFLEGLKIGCWTLLSQKLVSMINEIFHIVGLFNDIF